MLNWFSHPTGRIDALVLNELPPAGAREVRTHLKGCDGCRAKYDERVRVLRAARGGSEDAFAAGRVETAVLDALQGHPERAVPIGRWVLVSAGVAAMLAVVVGGYLASHRDVGEVLPSQGTLLVNGDLAQPGTHLPAGATLKATKGDAAVVIGGVRGVLLREGATMTVVNGHAVSVDAGRARFSVKPQSGDFAVTAGATEVRVTGTVFVVDRTWGPQKDKTLVAVHRGSVQVRAPQGTVELTQGRQAVPEGDTLVVRDVMAGALTEDRPSILDQLVKLLQQLVRGIDEAVNGR